MRISRARELTRASSTPPEGYEFDCVSIGLEQPKTLRATSASRASRSQIPEVVISRNAGSVGRCGLVRAFLADACVSFQLVNASGGQLRSPSPSTLTFYRVKKKYRWIRYQATTVSPIDPFVLPIVRRRTLHAGGDTFFALIVDRPRLRNAATTANSLQRVHLSLHFVSRRVPSRRPRSTDRDQW